MKEFLEQFHTRHYQWSDFFLFTMLLCMLLTEMGQLIGSLLVTLPMRAVTDPFWVMFGDYFSFIGIWIAVIFAMNVIQRNRPMLKTLGPAMRNNRISYLLLGLLIGFLMNGLCILAAWLNKDIALSFAGFQPLPLLLLLFAVFVQSSAEELTGRCYGYYRITRGYKSWFFAILINSLVFAIEHMMNPGVSFLPLLEIFLTGIFFGLCVRYFDSLWLPFGIHTMWNYTQNIIFGLPNSGLVSTYSIFTLDAANARQSFAYGPSFGIEGTLLSTGLHILACLITWYFGRKRKSQPYDPWMDLELQKSAASA